MISSLALAAALLVPQEVYRLDSQGVSGTGDAGATRRVASLQKPWVARAWALSHGEEDPPVRGCSSCWLPSGHGPVDLSRALAASCNTYFLALASEVPPAVLGETFRDAGFLVDGALTPEAAIGLGTRTPRISPAALLESYARLVSVPWSSRDDVRLQVLAGLLLAAETGTASSVPMPGFLGKTGTSPAGGSTSGWAVLFDPTGARGFLLHLPRGTGALAARRLAESLRDGRDPLAEAARRPTPTAQDPGAGLVRVRLLAALSPPRDAAPVRVRNLGDSPARLDARSGDGYLGPGAVHALAPGDVLGESVWELELPSHGLLRRVRGSLEARGGALVLVSRPRDYVDGVVRAELPASSSARMVELAAAVLRFLSKGPRHGAEDVCDLTHCAWFTGLGPEVTWDSPRTARLVSSGSIAGPLLSDEAWGRALALARREGPSSWSGHCGGEPLTAHEVWGLPVGPGPVSCPRHPGPSATWRRDLRARDVESALGDLASLEVARRDGIRLVRAVYRDGRQRDFIFDEVHRLLAARLGWDALPSPPEAIERTGTGYRARGRGRGHRVGLCLGD